jgi:hypothetical protein
VLTAIRVYTSALSQTNDELRATIASVCSEYTSMMKALGLPVRRLRQYRFGIYASGSCS